MDVSKMQALVNYRRRDVTESFVSNDEILEYLKEGNRRVGNNYQYEWNKVSTTFTYTDGSIRYALSSVAVDLNEPINMFYDNSYYFNAVSPEEFMRLSSYGENIYAIDGDYLLMKTSFGTGTITFNYYSTYNAKTSAGSRINNLSTSTDEPLMPEFYQDCLVDFAAARCYQKEGMYDDYRLVMNDFMLTLQKMRSKIPSRKKHNPSRMQSPRAVQDSGIADITDPLNQL